MLTHSVSNPQYSLSHGGIYIKNSFIFRTFAKERCERASKTCSSPSAVSSVGLMTKKGTVSSVDREVFDLLFI